LIAVLGLAACADGAPRELDGGRDAGSISEPDASARFDGGAQLEVRTADGITHRGELIARYEQRRWWAAQDDSTLALYVGTPSVVMVPDQSIVFVRSSTIRDASWVPANKAPLRDLQRERGITIAKSPLDGVAFVFNGNEDYHLEENGYGDFAWDLSIVDERGRTYAGVGLTNEDYYVWDRVVRAPVAGRIVEVVRDAADRAPGPITDYAASNNLVGIELMHGYAVYLLHFRQGSIPSAIQVGAHVEIGDELGRVGNSGVTIAPHVHLAMLWWSNADQRYWSVPSELENLRVGTTSSSLALERWASPVTGSFIAN
jgi:hypothetical protein